MVYGCMVLYGVWHTTVVWCMAYTQRVTMCVRCMAVVWPIQPLYGCMVGQAVWGCMGPIQQENGVSWRPPMTIMTSFESSMALVCLTMPRLHHMMHVPGIHTSGEPSGHLNLPNMDRKPVVWLYGCCMDFCAVWAHTTVVWAIQQPYNAHTCSHAVCMPYSYTAYTIQRHTAIHHTASPQS